MKEKEIFRPKNKYVYSICCKDLDLDIIPKAFENIAICDLYLCCNYKVAGLEEEYKRWGIIRLE